MGAPATLFDQARNVAQRFVTGTKTQVGYLESGQFWRLREVARHASSCRMRSRPAARA